VHEPVASGAQRQLGRDDHRRAVSCSSVRAPPGAPPTSPNWHTAIGDHLGTGHHRPPCTQPVVGPRHHLVSPAAKLATPARDELGLCCFVKLLELSGGARQCDSVGRWDGEVYRYQMALFLAVLRFDHEMGQGASDGVDSPPAWIHTALSQTRMAVKRPP